MHIIQVIITYEVPVPETILYANISIPQNILKAW